MKLNFVQNSELNLLTITIISHKNFESDENFRDPKTSSISQLTIVLSAPAQKRELKLVSVLYLSVRFEQKSCIEFSFHYSPKKVEVVQLK